MVTIKSYQGGIVANPQSPVGVAAPQSAMGEELGRGLQKVGQALYDWQDEADTAQAKMADTKYADLIRNELYGDGTGFMYASGSDAMGRRGTVAERLKAAQDELLTGLSPAARARAQTAIQSRYQGALQSVDQHTAGEGRTYLNDASQARITMFAQEAIYKPDNAAIEMQRAEVELNDMAARNGWSPEVKEVERIKMRTEVHSGIITRLENVDPVAALAYLSEHKDEMAGQEVARLEGFLAPKVKEYRGRQIGAAAVNGQPLYPYSIPVEYAMGPARPNKPQPAVVSLIGRTVEDVLGQGAKVIITSGQENEGNQHGSNRHGTGNAADVKILRADGSVVKAGDPEIAEIARQAAKNGALGIGFGGEYMGGEHMHIDLVPPGPGQANTWASGGTAMRSEIVNLIGQRQAGGGQGLEALVNIEDPVERDAAIREYNLLTGVQQAQVDAAKAAAGQEAFQIIEQGGSVDGMPSQTRQYLGLEQMRALRGYEDTIRTGRKPITDDSLYVELSDMAARDPEAFMAADPILWRNQLDDADFQKFTDLRRNMITGTRTGTGSEASISAVRTSIKTVMEAAGIDGSKPAGAKTQLKLEADMLRWTEEFAKANDGRMPNAQEINKRAMAAVTPVTINPPGLNNEQTGYSFDINFAGQPVVQDGRVIRRNEITVETLTQSGVSIGGLAVPSGEVETFVQEYMTRYGVEPTPQEVIEGLAASGRYTQ